jgi:2-iminobutanoate/2-iminopropanoate deaminase
MSLVPVSTPAAPAAIGPYSQAVEATGSRFLFLSGQIPLDPATGQLKNASVAEEVAQVLANLQAVLAAAGASPASLVKTTIFLTDMADFAVVNEAYAAWLGDHRPARATIAVKALPRGARVEIEGIAIL